MTEILAGGCLCGAVRYTAQAAPMMAGHCQCVDCRKSSGTGHCTHAVVPKDAVSITGGFSSYERPADSGNMVTRSFCGICGAAVFSTNSAAPDLLFLRASSLDDPNAVTPGMVVYASRAAAWDYVDPTLPRFDTMPPNAPV